MLIISAPSGTGKSTLIRRLTQEFDNFSFSISCTTRAPRPGEQSGREYHFLSVQDFLSKRDQGYFAEWAEVHGNLYGTPRQATEDLLQAGRDIVFDIDVQGARQLKESMGQGCYVFIFPPSQEALKKRLIGRGTDSSAVIQRRLENARQEIVASEWFDHWIINDDLFVAHDQLRAIYLAEKNRPRHMFDWSQKIQKEWLGT